MSDVFVKLVGVETDGTEGGSSYMTFEVPAEVADSQLWPMPGQYLLRRVASLFDPIDKADDDEADDDEGIIYDGSEA